MTDPLADKRARVDRLEKRYAYWLDSRRPSPRRTLMLRYLRPKLRSARARLKRAERVASTVSGRGVELVKRFEGFSPTVYDDGLGFETIGYGFRYPEEYARPTITRKEADALLRVKLNGTYGDAVRKASRLAKWRLNQNQFDALVSLTFNLGTGWVGAKPGQTGATLWAAFKDRDRKGVADALLLYVNPGTSVEAGLRRRRQAERELWLR